MQWLGPSAEAGLSTAVFAHHVVREYSDSRIISHQGVLSPYRVVEGMGLLRTTGWFIADGQQHGIVGSERGI
jgi:hypothetical protein